MAVRRAFNSLITGVQYLAARLALADKGVAPLQGDTAANLWTREAYAPLAEDNINGVIAMARRLVATATYAPVVVFTVTALAAKLILKAAPGVLDSVTGRIDSSAPSGTYYIQTWNLTDVPVDTTALSLTNSLHAALKIQHTQNVDSPFTIQFNYPTYASAGITIGLSTTEFTKTAAGAYLLINAASLA